MKQQKRRNKKRRNKKRRKTKEETNENTIFKGLKLNFYFGLYLLFVYLLLINQVVSTNFAKQ